VSPTSAVAESGEKVKPLLPTSISIVLARAAAIVAIMSIVDEYIVMIE